MSLSYQFALLIDGEVQQIVSTTDLRPSWEEYLRRGWWRRNDPYTIRDADGKVIGLFAPGVIGGLMLLGTTQAALPQKKE